MSIRRDYKPTSTWQRRRLVVRRHGLLVITLILVGLFGGLFAYIKGDRTRETPVTAAPPMTPVVTPPAPAVVTSTPAAPESFKPKYDFYTELPKRQVDIQ